MNKQLILFSMMAGLTAFSVSAQTNGRPLPSTISGFSSGPVSGHTPNVAPGLSPQPVSGFRTTTQAPPQTSMPRTLNPNPVPQFSSPVSGFQSAPVSGFSNNRFQNNRRFRTSRPDVTVPSAVSGFNSSPVNGLTTNVPGQQFSTNISQTEPPQTVAPTTPAPPAPPSPF